VARYFLARHVYFCGRGDVWVFLDLRRDTYWMIRGAQAASFTGWLAAGMVKDRDTPALPDCLRDLLSTDLLTTDEPMGKPIMPTDSEPPTVHLLDEAGEPIKHVRVRELVQFLLACALTTFRLRFRHLERILARCGDRKARRIREPLPVERARELVVSFRRLRRLFPSNYLCLFDSLALLEFLARNGVFPDLVFAVAPDPWSAHCWIQAGEIIFNEGVEESRDFLPIMVV